MPEQKTYTEMLEEARKVFGPQAEVKFSDGQWDISTGIEEKFDPESVKDLYPEAYKASQEYEATYGSELDRWAYKSGMGWSSQAEIFKAFEECTVARFKESLSLVREWQATGKKFDWPGGEEYRDTVLRIAEARGW